jgi:hypothetical protein
MLHCFTASVLHRFGLSLSEHRVMTLNGAGSLSIAMFSVTGAEIVKDIALLSL